MAMNARMRKAARIWVGRVKRHPKKTAVAGLGLAGFIWLAIGVWTIYQLNKLTPERRFEQAKRDIASVPRQQVYREVLEHEWLLRSLQARGAVAPPLVQVDGGVIDPLMQEILRPSTLAEKVRMKPRPTRDPQVVASLLEQRNAELKSQLDAGVVRGNEDLRSSSDAMPSQAFDLDQIAPSRRQPEPRAQLSQQALQAADEVKALCAAKGDAVKELGNACADPEIFVTRAAQRAP